MGAPSAKALLVTLISLVTGIVASARVVVIVVVESFDSPVSPHAATIPSARAAADTRRTRYMVIDQQ
jgi:hypothetical protein